jgi:hypothetical protein
MTTSWRDLEGFGRPEEVEPQTFNVVGPDNEDHAPGCMFNMHEGILPCSCDATRVEYSWWWKCWLRWQKARVSRHHSVAPRDRMPWPVKGPDGDPWIPGIDFNDE